MNTSNRTVLSITLAALITASLSLVGQAQAQNSYYSTAASGNFSNTPGQPTGPQADQGTNYAEKQKIFTRSMQQIGQTSEAGLMAPNSVDNSSWHSGVYAYGSPTSFTPSPAALINGYGMSLPAVSTSSNDFNTCDVPLRNANTLYDAGPNGSGPSGSSSALNLQGLGLSSGPGPATYNNGTINFSVGTPAVGVTGSLNAQQALNSVNNFFGF